VLDGNWSVFKFPFIFFFFRLNGVRIPKGRPQTLPVGAKIMLSDQKDKYQWRFVCHPQSIADRQTIVDRRDEDGFARPPPAKRVKFESLVSSSPNRN
jgi:hypothetical protein